MVSSKDGTFVACSGWFEQFKKCSRLYNIKVTDEAASVDTEAAS